MTRLSLSYASLSKQHGCENKDLRQANAILKLTSICFETELGGQSKL
jgi:hypothetical protein